MRTRLTIVLALFIAIAAVTLIHLVAIATRQRNASAQLWARALETGGQRRHGREVILALFVSRRAPQQARVVAGAVDSMSSPYVWPVLVTRRESFARRVRAWAPRATVVTDSSLDLLRGLLPLRGYPAISAVPRQGGIPRSKTGFFGRSRVVRLLASRNSAGLASALRAPLALPESLALVDLQGRVVEIALPRETRPQLWTYSAKGCGNCEPMLKEIERVIGPAEIDWYHVAYGGDFEDGRWPLRGRKPLSIFTDPWCSVADAFQVESTPGYVLIDAKGEIRSRATGREAYRDLEEALGAGH